MENQQLANFLDFIINVIVLIFLGFILMLIINIFPQNSEVSMELVKGPYKITHIDINEKDFYKFHLLREDNTEELATSVISTSDYYTYVDDTSNSSIIKYISQKYKNLENVFTDAYNLYIIRDTSILFPEYREFKLTATNKVLCFSNSRKITISILIFTDNKYEDFTTQFADYDFSDFSSKKDNENSTEIEKLEKDIIDETPVHKKDSSNDFSDWAN